VGFNPEYASNYLPLPSGTPTAGEVPAATGTGSASSWQLALQLQAATAVGGFALQDATPTIISWTAPSDGKLHRCMIFTLLSVTLAETGGACQATVTPPSGAQQSFSIFAAGKAAGVYHGDGASFGDLWGLLVEAGTTVTLAQSSALTAGTASVWAEIWGA
jgi:hypothetical protein